MKATKQIVPLALVALIGGGTGAAVAVAVDGGSTTTVTASAPSAAVPSVVRDDGSGFSADEIYQRSKDSVAFITSQITTQSDSPFGQAQQGVATGSGFVVSKAGYIATNAHVVDGASSVKVKIGDGQELSAQVVGKDGSTDVALLKVDAGSQQLTPLTFGDSSKLNVGDPTFAIGNPYGLDRTLTTGVVSALQRQIQAPDGFSIDNVVQTDAALNPGNSGGPLLNAAGQVIGINSQIESSPSSSGETGGNVGIGFAVPSNTVKQVVAQLMNGGQVAHAYLGVQTADGEGTGATVAGLSPSSPAKDAGITTGDVIVSFDGKSVETSADLSADVNGAAVGDKVSVGVRRNGSERTVQVTLGTRPAGTQPAAVQG
jgi:putative serine protease PepD